MENKIITDREQYIKQLEKENALLKQYIISNLNKDILNDEVFKLNIKIDNLELKNKELRKKYALAMLHII